MLALAARPRRGLHVRRQVDPSAPLGLFPRTAECSAREILLEGSMASLTTVVGVGIFAEFFDGFAVSSFIIMSSTIRSNTGGHVESYFSACLSVSMDISFVFYSVSRRACHFQDGSGNTHSNTLAPGPWPIIIFAWISQPYSESV